MLAATNLQEATNAFSGNSQVLFAITNVAAKLESGGFQNVICNSFEGNHICSREIRNVRPDVSKVEMFKTAKAGSQEHPAHE